MKHRMLPKRLVWRAELVLGVLAIVVGVGVVSLAPKSTQQSHAQDGENGEPLVVLNEDNIKQATVLVMQVSDQSGSPIITCIGSGTLVSTDGLILTNAHIVTSANECVANRLVIGLTVRIDEPPVPIYAAEIIELSRGFDLAVLRITTFLDGRVIEPGSLQLPFVELGDSTRIALDETLHVFGYPDVEDQIVDVRRGTVSGFTSEARVGVRAWMRTTANIPGLMSGGGAYNADGQLIGIPTVIPARVADTVVDCRQLYDTTGDARIDENDSCVPIGGPITAIRPSRLARGLVQAAALGIQPGPQRSVFEAPPPENPPEFSNLFFSTGVNEAEMPISAAESVPDGTSTIYLFFDYNNMVDGTIYELRTTLDGRPSPLHSLPPVTWNGGQQGLWYIGTTLPEWQPGTYEFTLLIEGRQAGSKTITVGGAPSTEPQFSDLVFGIENALQELVGANYVVPEGNVIRARFNYRDMRTGVRYRYQWYFNGSPLDSGSGELTWESEETQGTNSELAIRSEAGFVSGRYRLELFIESSVTPDEFRLALLSDFVVAGGAGGANDAEALIFSNFRFAQRAQANLPLGINTNFPSNVPAVYIFFDWRQISPGTPWTWRWLVDGEVLIEEHSHWPEQSNGENFYLSLVGSPTLPDATYTIEIEINGIPMTEERDQSAGVGLGQLPVESFANAEGLRMIGEVVDAETGEGVEGAMFIVLVAEFSVEDFTWRNDQVLGIAQADRKGFFQIPVLIPRGTEDEPALYSVIVRADGYFPASADGIEVTESTRSPLEIRVVLNRD